MSAVTVAGCGLMGGSLIAAFMKAGHQVNIYDINEEAAKPYVAQGARYFANLEEALETKALIICLPNYPIVVKLLEGCVAGVLQDQQIINLTTSTPEEAIETDALAKKLGARYLDGKIECYPKEVGTEASFLVFSGDQVVFEENLELLKALSNEPTYFGTGAGAAAVFDIGLVVTPHVALFFAVLEGTALAMKYGFPLEHFTSYLGALLPNAASIIERQIADNFTDFTGSYKDADEASLETETAGMKLVVDALQQAGVDTSFSQNMLDTMKNAVAQGYGGKSIVAIMSQMKKQ